MTALGATLFRLGSRAAPARCLPFAAFVALMASEPIVVGLLPAACYAPWLYGLRSAVATGLLAWCWSELGELHTWPRWTVQGVARATATGLLVLALWIALDFPPFVIGDTGSGFVATREDGSLDWPLALLRLAGSSLVVPVIEEVFWRSFITRWLESRAWVALQPAAIGGRALLMSSIAFGFEHHQWAAGTAAGLAYGWLYRRSGSLWPAVLAHAVTNAGLGLWVIGTGAWQFW